VIRSFKNWYGEGKFFTIFLLDKASSEIEGMFFNDLCDHFYNRIQRGNIYTFQGGSIRNDGRKFRLS